MNDVTPKLRSVPIVAELDTPEALLDRGDYFSQIGRNQEALRDYDAALELDASACEGIGWLKRGHVLSRLGRFASAAVSYREATTHRVGLRGARAWLCLAATLERMNRVNEAIRVLDEYLERRPTLALRGEGRALVERARLLHRVRRTEEAARSYLCAAENDPRRATEAGDYFLFERNDAEVALALYELDADADVESTMLARRAAVSLLVGEECAARTLWSRAVRKQRGVEQFAELWAGRDWRVSRAVVELAQADETVPDSGFWQKA